MHRIKKYIFFNKYKMFEISAETYAKNCVHTIEVNKNAYKKY